MKFILIDDREFTALSGLPHVCYAIYVILKKLMDLNTGIVGGAKRRISWQSLAEELYIVRVELFIYIDKKEEKYRK